MRIVIAEDSAVIRAGLAEILADRGHVVVAAVGNAEDLQSAVGEHHPDAAVVDVRMPPSSATWDRDLWTRCRATPARSP